jgi:group I intron endonuclease
MYIGQTIQKNPKMRWYDHCARTRNGQNNHLYNSMRLHGVENFVWEVIDSANNLDELNLKEQHWLDEYRKITEVYNIREAGNNKTHSQKSKEKMKESQRQAHARRRLEGTDTWTRRDGGPMLGKAHPGKGKPHTKRWTDEMKAAHSIRCKKREEKKRLIGQGE